MKLYQTFRNLLPPPAPGRISVGIGVGVGIGFGVHVGIGGVRVVFVTVVIGGNKFCCNIFGKYV